MAGADGLAKQLRLLHMGSPGFKLPKVTDASKASLAAAWRCSILAKLVPPPTQNMFQIRSAFLKALAMHTDDFNIERISLDLIVLRFRNHLDMARTWHRQPFVIYTSLALLAEWDGVADPATLDFDLYECWVQIKPSHPMMLTAELA